MASTDDTLLAPAKIAETLGASPAKVKKAIAALGLQPSAKKGICCLYDAAAVARIAANLG